MRFLSFGVLYALGVCGLMVALILTIDPPERHNDKPWVVIAPWETAVATPTPLPSVEASPTPEATAVLDVLSLVTGEFIATRYGENYNGQGMGCDGTPYRSEDTSILAAPPSRYMEWPCGTKLRVCRGTSNTCIDVVRVDSCPGCGPLHIDISEAGMSVLCFGSDYYAANGVTCDRLNGLSIFIVQAGASPAITPVPPTIKELQEVAQCGSLFVRRSYRQACLNGVE